jgi:uncharacterized membrane protein
MFINIEFSTDNRRICHFDSSEILRERYAKSEISKDRYDKMRDDLGKC